jgi:phosphoribosylaminoimidazolecarboxamide formyltransferase/IMP cyclohydrolase
MPMPRLNWRRIRGQAPGRGDRQARQPLRRGAGRDLLEAWQGALACDSVSAFGGIVAVNVPLDGPTAEAICEIFTEVVVAPGADEAAKAAFAARRTCACCSPAPARSAPAGLDRAPIAGGLLVQDPRQWAHHEADLKVVTKRAPTEQELKDCLFAWTVAKHVKSNAIVYAKDGVTAGIGAGQMNRAIRAGSPR